MTTPHRTALTLLLLTILAAGCTSAAIGPAATQTPEYHALERNYTTAVHDRDYLNDQRVSLEGQLSNATANVTQLDDEVASLRAQVNALRADRDARWSSGNASAANETAQRERALDAEYARDKLWADRNATRTNLQKWADEGNQGLTSASFVPGIVFGHFYANETPLNLQRGAASTYGYRAPVMPWDQCYANIERCASGSTTTTIPSIPTTPQSGQWVDESVVAGLVPITQNAVDSPIVYVDAGVRHFKFVNDIACTGSMRPSIDCGDILLGAEPVLGSDIKVGDVVSYTIPSGTRGCSFAGDTILHRVVAVNSYSGTLWYTTRGDNNNGNDDCPVAFDWVNLRMVALLKNAKLPPGIVDS